MVVSEAPRHVLADRVRAQVGAAGAGHFDDLLERLHLEQVGSDAALWRQLARAEGVWASRIEDGEAAGVIEGLYAGLPVLAPRTPPNTAMAGKVGERLMLYDAASPHVMADALHAFEQVCRAQPARPRPAPAEGNFDVLAYHVGFVIDRLEEHGDA